MFGKHGPTGPDILRDPQQVLMFSHVWQNMPEAFRDLFLLPPTLLVTLGWLTMLAARVGGSAKGGALILCSVDLVTRQAAVSVGLVEGRRDKVRNTVWPPLARCRNTHPFRASIRAEP